MSLDRSKTLSKIFKRRNRLNKQIANLLVEPSSLSLTSKSKLVLAQRSIKFNDMISANQLS